MRNLILLAGTAALALAAPAAAEKGGHGGGHGQGGGHAKAEQRGGHGQGGGHAKEQRGGHGQGGGHAAMAERGGGHGAKARGDKGHGGQQVARGGNGHSWQAPKPHRAERQTFRRDDRRDDRFVRRAVDDRRGRDFDFRRDDRRGREPEFRRDERRFAGFDRGCPPGLARKHNGCLPPGQAKKLFRVGDRARADWFDGYDRPNVYRSFYYDTPDYAYRYDNDGYIYRVDRGSGLIGAIIPLFGGGFAVGQPLPAGYDVYNVPMRYRDTWYDDDDYLYRYGDNAIYRVDAGSGIIDGIVSLLAGDFNVGQRLPMGYDAYNVPFDYRDRYNDDDDYLYRYADGNIYQVDAKTQLIQAIVEMIV